MTNVKKKIELKNCVKLKIQDPEITRVDVLKGIVNSKILRLSDIDVASQLFNNYSWFITLKNEINAKDLFGKKVTINNKECVILDPNFVKEKTTMIKIMWLPHNFDNKLITNYFSAKKLKVVNVTDEFMREEGFESIKTGNIRVKLSGPEAEQMKIRGGVYEIGQHRCLFIKAGEKPTCILCNIEGHIKRHCPKRSIQCANCKKFGHEDSECSLARRLQEDKAIFPEQEAEVEYNSEASNKNNDNTAISHGYYRNKRSEKNKETIKKRAFQFTEDSSPLSNDNQKKGKSADQDLNCEDEELIAVSQLEREVMHESSYSKYSDEED